MLLVLYASAVLLAVTQNVTARVFFNRNSRSDSAVFNGIKSLSALVLFVGYTLVWRYGPYFDETVNELYT